VILVVGYPGDRTVRHLLTAAERHGLAFLSLVDFYETGEVIFSTHAPEDAFVSAADETFRPGDYSGICQRVYPPFDVPVGPRKWREMMSRYAALNLLLASLDVTVVNRPVVGWENSSKLLQAFQLQRFGFEVPPSLSTSIAGDYRRFRENTQTIYKSNSSVRSVVDDVTGIEEERLPLLRRCPVLFQHRVVGIDVRVHVVGTQVFGVGIDSDAVDYRYVRRQGTYARMSAHDVPAEIAELCVAFAAEYGLCIAGFDFKLDEAGTWYCLEMNPWPGFEAYDDVLGGRIAQAVLDVLGGGREPTGASLVRGQA
jgi:hypothetical protein